MIPRRHIAILGCLPLASITMVFCSCAHQPLDPQWRISMPPKFDINDPWWWWHPPKVTEIIPPNPTTPVEVALHPEFSTDCSSEFPGLKHVERVQATEAGLREVHGRQERLLSQVAPLLAQARNNIGRMVGEWHGALVELQSNAAKRWPETSREAYQDIVDRVLTERQRQEYNYHKARGKKRDDIWCWLFPTDEQRQKILQRYSQGLQESQDAWYVSRILGTSTHQEVDRLLDEMQESIAMAKDVSFSHKAISEDVATVTKRYRQAGRELRWLQANLKAEDDPKIKIKLRKQIADKYVESERLQLDAKKQGRLLTSHTWRMDEVTKAQDMVKSSLQALKDFHGNHCDVLAGVSVLKGRTSDACEHGYRILRETLLRGMMTARKHCRHLSPSILRKVDNIPGGAQ